MLQQFMQHLLRPNTSRRAQETPTVVPPTTACTRTPAPVAHRLTWDDPRPAPHTFSGQLRLSHGHPRGRCIR
jgi:hypothetical protein